MNISQYTKIKEAVLQGKSIIVVGRTNTGKNHLLNQVTAECENYIQTMIDEFCTFDADKIHEALKMGPVLSTAYASSLDEFLAYEAYARIVRKIDVLVMVDRTVGKELTVKTVQFGPFK